MYLLSGMRIQEAQLLSVEMCGHHVKEPSDPKIVQQKWNKVWIQLIESVISFLNHKDIAHVAMQGTSEPHEMLPGTEGDSDNQKVPPSRSSTFI